MYDYLNAGNDAQPEVLEAIERFRELPEEERQEEVLLYWLLGSGTPPYKVSKEDSEYTDDADSKQSCDNCEFLYLKNNNNKYICSQIRGRVKPSGWCNRWENQMDKFNTLVESYK